MTPRTDRQQRLDRALIETMQNIGDYVMPDKILRTEITLRVPHLNLTTAELDEAIRHADTARRIVGVPTETGTKWKLTDAGRAWAAENL